MSQAIVTSGSNIGRNSKKTVGCENCNFMMDYTVWKKENVKTDAPNSSDTSNPKTKRTHAAVKCTGSTCPRCGLPTVRLFDSQAEFQYFRELKLREEKGEVEDIECQVKFDLSVPEFETGEPVKIGAYVADFGYFENSQEGKDYVIVDVKNKNMIVSEMSKWKIKHFEKQYGIPVTLVGR